MKTKLLKKIRREVNYKYFTLKNEVMMSIYSTDIDPPFVVIYDCQDEEQAKSLCDMERKKMMEGIVERRKWKREANPDIKQINKIRRPVI